MSTRPTARPTREFHGLDEIALRAEGTLAARIGSRRLLGLELDRAWAGAVGDRVRAVTRLHRVRDGVLEVHVVDAAWQRELRRLERDILPRLAERLSSRRLVAIRFVVHPGLFREAARAEPRPARRAQDGGPEAPVLSDRLRRVMGRYLDRTGTG